MYKESKFPSIDKDDWIAANRELVDEELSKYEGLFKEESVNAAFQNLVIEYLYLQNLMESVTDWRANFLSFIADTIRDAENEIAHRSSAVELQNGRMMVVRRVLEWF